MLGARQANDAPLLHFTSMRPSELQLGFPPAKQRSMAKVPALAGPQLAPCAFSERACRLWAARYSQSEAQPLGVHP